MKVFSSSRSIRQVFFVAVAALALAGGASVALGQSGDTPRRRRPKGRR